MAYFRKYHTTKGELRWKAEVKLRGARSLSKSFRRFTDAKQWAKQQEEAAQRLSCGIQEAKRFTLNEAVERYLLEHLPTLSDQITNKSILAWWQQHLGERYLDSLAPHEIIRLRQKLASESIAPEGKPPRFRSPRTLQAYVSCLSHLCKIALQEWGWLTSNPLEQVKKLKIKNERTRFLSDHTHLWPGESTPRHWDDLTPEERREAARKFPRAYELPRLQDALKAQGKEDSPIHYKGEWAFLLFSIQITTGLRLAEATHMVWEENDLVSHPIIIADMARNVLILKSTKHDPSPRMKPICGAAHEALQALYAERRYDTPLVFPRRDGIKPLDFRRRITKAICDAGLDDFHWHDLRHTTASYLSMMGASQREIMEALHHRTIQSSGRYTHLSNTHMRGLMDQFSQSMFESPQGSSRFDRAGVSEASVAG